MRVIVINPWTQEISETEFSGLYSDLYRLLSGPTLEGLPDARVTCFDITSLRAIPNHDLFVDDEGFINGEPQAYFEVDGRTFAGRGVLACSDDAGETTDATAEVSEVIAAIRFLPPGTRVHLEPIRIHSFETTEDLIRFLGGAGDSNI